MVNRTRLKGGLLLLLGGITIEYVLDHGMNGEVGILAAGEE